MIKELKIMSKKLVILTIIFSMLISYFSKVTNVFAVSNTKTLAVNFRGDNANYGKVEYTLDDGAHWSDISENVNLNITVLGDNLRLKIVPNENYSVDYAGIELNLDGTRYSQLSEYGFESNNGYSVPSNIESVELSQVEFRENQGGQPAEEPALNKFSNVNIHIEGEELEYDNPWSNDAADFIFGINNSPEMRRLAKNEVNYIVENNEIVGLNTKNSLNYQYDYNNEGTVTFHIRTQWDDVITSLKINNVLYNTPQTKETLAAAFDGGGLAFDIPNVTFDETYNIEVVGRKQTEEEKIIGNFGWTYDEHTNEYSDDDRILHGTLDFVKAVYNNVTYTNIEQINSVGGLFAWNNGVRGTDDPTGEATFPTGTVLTLRLIPDVGYQLTSFDLNGFPFEPGEETGLYTFTIGGGNWHLGAHFTAVNDEVKANSQNIKSGAININKNDEDNFENGTAKLEVDDVISLSPNRVEQFENTATKEGYELENYLDVSLYNSIYKGGKKDVDGNYESWDKQIDNLKNKATITLDLENDMNGKNLAIIHEKHNGNTITGYELIDVIYNEENNTITFETDSFSNYAIVSKETTNTTKYTVHFDSNGGSQIEDKKVTSGNSIAEPNVPINEGLTFDGWYEDKTLTTKFNFNTPITGDVTLYAKWIDNRNKEYTINDDNGNTINFKEEDGHTYHFNIIDYLKFSDEELEAADISKEMYNEVLNILKNITKDYGELLAFYEIEIQNEDGYLVHESPTKFKIKIKMTDEMKKYNTFKMIYVDSENNFATESPITLTIEGDYLVGTLEHLSTYVLAGSITNNTSNPQTGDNINIWIEMLIISTLGLSIGIFTANKFKKAKVKY